MHIHTQADLLNAAASALAKRDGHAFDRIREINRNWLQSEEEAAATDAALQAMQEAAYLLEGEPSEMDDGTEWDGVQN
jgi:hypothetical protein